MLNSNQEWKLTITNPQIIKYNINKQKYGWMVHLLPLDDQGSPWAPLMEQASSQCWTQGLAGCEHRPPGRSLRWDFSDPKLNRWSNPDRNKLDSYQNSRPGYRQGFTCIVNCFISRVSLMKWRISLWGKMASSIFFFWKLYSQVRSMLTGWCIEQKYSD